MVEIPNIDLFLGEAALGGVLVTAIAGLIKIWVKSDAVRLVVALGLSFVIGACWVGWYAWVGGAAFQWSQVLMYAVPIYASSSAVFGALRSARKPKP